MTMTFKPKADPLQRKSSDKGYRVAWKYKYKFEKGHFDEELTYGEALRKAEELEAKEPDKVFWPELMYEQ
ncbi:MAG TPA: hypothetical protein EYP40_08255 [Chromatiales bacterium]|nr:hypothetical protein [Chromatiales bacterium]